VNSRTIFLAKLLDETDRASEVAALLAERGLPDPSKQPTPAAATQPTSRPALIGPIDDDTGRFAKKIVADWENDGVNKRRYHRGNSLSYGILAFWYSIMA